MPSDTPSTPSNSPPSSSTSEPVPTIHQIVEKYLPSVQWINPLKGLCLCPGREKHTTKSTKKDCAIFLDGPIPTVYCFHQNCQEEVDEANQNIRDAWRYFQPEVSPEERQRLLEDSEKRHALESRTVAAKPAILEKYAWNLPEPDRDGRIPTSLPDHFLAWRDRIWNPEALIWIGEPHHSGQFFHKTHFMLAGEAMMKGHFTCASTFKSGSFSRANDGVSGTPYMIVEGDAVVGAPVTDAEKQENKKACAAIFNWLRREMNLDLRCVIDSGNKSLHGWFRMPDKNVFDQLKIMLPVLGCDKAMFKPSQPARLPGILRENGNPQQLLYLA